MEAFPYKQLYMSIDEQMPFYRKRWTHMPVNSLSLAIREELHSFGSQELQRNVFYGEMPAEAPALLFVLPLPSQSTWPLLPLRLTLTALEACQKQTGRQPLALKWLLLADTDENMLPEIIRAHQRRLQAAYCLWHVNEHIEESTNIFFLGCKGKLTVELTTQTGNQPRPSTDGTFMPNALWRLAWALGSLKSEQEEVLLAEFYDTIELPEEEMLTPLYSLPVPMGQFLLNLHGFQLHYARLFTPTCTITTIEGGQKATLPAKARAEVEFHLVPGQRPEQILRNLEQHMIERGFPDIEIRLLESFAASSTSLHSPIAQALRCASLPEPLILPASAGCYPASVFDPTIPVVFTCLNEQEECVKRVATLMMELSP